MKVEEQVGKKKALEGKNMIERRGEEQRGREDD